jgi:hypothetical protein
MSKRLFKDGVDFYCFIAFVVHKLTSMEHCWSDNTE